MENYSSNLIPTMTSNTTPSGIAMADSFQTNFDPYKAFDNNTSFWYGNLVNSGWIGYQFVSPKIISSYLILPAGSSTNHVSPKNWTFEGSNNGTNWDILDTNTNISDWAVGVTKSYEFINKNAYKFYRVNISSTVNATVKPALSTLEMYELVYSNKILLSSGDKYYYVKNSKTDEKTSIPIMTSNTAPSGVAISSNAITAYRAFDNYTGSSWYTDVGVTAGWVGYEFPSLTKIGEYGIWAYTVENNPKDWTFEGSNDGMNWTVLDTRENVTGWVTDEKRNYKIKNPLDFKSYRINITKNNGGTRLQFGDLFMFKIEVQYLEKSDRIQMLDCVDDTVYFELYKVLKSNVSNATSLGSGKTFEHTIDMSKRRVDKIVLG